MTVNRRDLVRWIALSPMAWVALPGCAPSDGEKSPGSDDECCDAPDGDTAVPTDSAAPEDSARPEDSATPDDTDLPDDTDPPDDTAEPSECAVASDQQGPYYTEGAPEKSDLKEGDGGTPIRIEGRIVDASDCNVALAGAVFDAWHANHAGEYDNEGYAYRGRVTADEDGNFTLETVLPGSYPTRPVLHIHFKIWDATGALRITSQLYFAGDAEYNASVHPGPLLTLDDAGVAQITLGV